MNWKRQKHESTVSNEVWEVTRDINPNKSLGYDFITEQILKELAIIGIKYRAHLLKAVLQEQTQWKVAQNPENIPNELQRYRPISLLCSGYEICDRLFCRPASLTRIYHNKLCRLYCSTSRGQWSSRCFTETTNLRSRIPKLVYEMMNKR
jgi:hypothetical protein